MPNNNLQNWYDFIKEDDPSKLQDMLHDDAVFTSPVVHTPQRGRALVTAYLSAASKVLGGDEFKYVREFDCGDRAVIEFICQIDGIEINGIDMIEWDQDGKITDFKVMVRPLKAIQKLHQMMAAMLQAQANG
jgi:SnoaL-like domain